VSGAACRDEACCPGTRARHRGHALLLSAITVGYNVVEGVVSLAFGAAAGSAALIGFGLDSFMESMSGGVMLWRFGRRWSSPEHEARAERRAVTLVGVTFFLFAGYVLYESARKLVLAEPPDPSLPGIIIALVSIVTMPALFLVKRRVARRLNSPSLAADSKQTLACSLLSVALLLGIGLNRLFGLWQADPAVGLLTGLWLVKEGITTLRERRLCTC
jgi:cation diffusion facilitator family transporter